MNRKYELGAAMIESILILSGMVVLMVAIPSLAKRQDIRQTTVDASRYATWQMTVTNSADRELIIDRFFSKPDSSIRTAQTQLDVNSHWQIYQAPLVRDSALTPATNSGLAAGRQPAVPIVDRRSVNLEIAEQVASTGGVAETITGTIRTVSDWMGRSTAIASNRGVVRSTVSVKVRSQDNENKSGQENQCASAFGTSSSGSNQCLAVTSALLVDGWEASDNQDVEEGARTMVPTKLLDPLGELLNVVSAVPLLKEFKGIDDSFGCVNTTLLPTKELTGELSTDVGNPHAC